MKYSLALLFVLAPSLAFAGVAPNLDILEIYSDLFQNLALWTTIIVAFVTTVMVWLGGRSLHGGVMGALLDYFSIGMTLMFFGYLVNVPKLAKLFPLQYPPTLVHDVLFMIAYILMGLGINKLFKIIKGE